MDNVFLSLRHCVRLLKIIISSFKSTVAITSKKGKGCPSNLGAVGEYQRFESTTIRFIIEQREFLSTILLIKLLKST